MKTFVYFSGNCDCISGTTLAESAVQTTDYESDDITCTLFNGQPFVKSSSGILSRGFMMSRDRQVGLASILDHNPDYMISSREHDHGRSGSHLHNDLEPNDIQGQKVTHTPSGNWNDFYPESCQCQEIRFSQHVMTTVHDGHAGGLVPVLNISPCSKTSHNDEPPGQLQTSGDFQTKDDFDLCCHGSRTRCETCLLYTSPSPRD